MDSTEQGLATGAGNIGKESFEAFNGDDKSKDDWFVDTSDYENHEWTITYGPYSRLKAFEVSRKLMEERNIPGSKYGFSVTIRRG